MGVPEAETMHEIFPEPDQAAAPQFTPLPSGNDAQVGVQEQHA